MNFQSVGLGRKRRLRYIAVASSCLASVIGAPSLVHAATASADATPSGQVTEIVVTARKRVENVQDIPVAVSVVGKDQLQKYDVSGLENVAHSSPDLIITRAGSGSGASLIIHGVGPNTSSIGIEQSVAVIVDGVYYGQGRTIDEGFLDLSQVEILKGPQALFYGKNATTGVISIITNDPGPHFEARASTAYEFTGRQIFNEAEVSGPLTETLGFRIAFRANNMFGGYFHNGAGPVNYTTTDFVTHVTTNHLATPASSRFPGVDQYVGRLTLLWKPTNELTSILKITGDSRNDNSPYWNTSLYACPNNVSQVANHPCSLKFTSYEVNMPADIAKDFPFAPSDGHVHSDYHSWGVTENLKYEIPWVTLTSTTNYNQVFDQWLGDTLVDASNTFGAWNTEQDKWRTFSEEARALTSFHSPINGLLGFYYQKTSFRFNQVGVLSHAENSAAPAGLRYAANEKYSTTNGETYSIYGQAIWKIIPTVELTAGARYIHETKNSYFVQPYANPRIAAYIANHPLAANQVFTHVNPEVTLTWKPVQNLTLYAAYKTGFKSGGFSNSSVQGPASTVSYFAFQPEEAEGYEGGLKSTLFDNQVRFNVDIFYTKYTNLQVDFLNTSIPSSVTTNAGGALTKGVEIQADYAPRFAPGLSLHAVLNYTNAYYTNFIAPCNTGQTPAQGCNLPPIVGGGFTMQNLAGVHTADAPTWAGSLGADYERQINDRFKFDLSGNLRYSGSYLANAFANPLEGFMQQNAYTMFDMSIGVATIDNRWRLQLIGKNLTNVAALTSAGGATFTGARTGKPTGVLPDFNGSYMDPRTVELMLSWRY